MTEDKFVHELETGRIAEPADDRWQSQKVFEEHSAESKFYPGDYLLCQEYFEHDP